MQNIVKEIASYIVKEAQDKAGSLSDGLNYIVSKADIQEAFNEQIDRAVYDSVLDALNERDEVADVTEDIDGVDVVLYSNYAPNYTGDAEDEGGDAEALKKALIGLKDAFVDVLDACDYEKEFNSKYPFGKCFLELTHDVIAWVESEVM